MSWPDVCYQYDGSFEGFLTCVYESYVRKEYPIAFVGPEDARITLYPERFVHSHREHALRVYRSLSQRISPQGQRLASLAFLTCLGEKERAIYDFIRLGYDVGRGVVHWLTDPRVDVLNKAVGHLTHEVHLYQGFVRFSDYHGLLAGEICPKNRVLPLLRPHFCGRFSGETFLLYDRTHQEALLHQPQPEHWAIVPMAELRLAPPGAEEQTYRALWRAFYDAIAIEGRLNPKLRMTHMPKRYWDCMTEFGDLAPPGGKPCEGLSKIESAAT